MIRYSLQACGQPCAVCHGHRAIQPHLPNPTRVRIRVRAVQRLVKKPRFLQRHGIFVCVRACVRACVSVCGVCARACVQARARVCECERVCGKSEQSARVSPCVCICVRGGPCPCLRPCVLVCARPLARFRAQRAGTSKRRRECATEALSPWRSFARILQCPGLAALYRSAGCLTQFEG